MFLNLSKFVSKKISMLYILKLILEKKLYFFTRKILCFVNCKLLQTKSNKT